MYQVSSDHQLGDERVSLCYQKTWGRSGVEQLFGGGLRMTSRTNHERDLASSRCGRGHLASERTDPFIVRRCVMTQEGGKRSAKALVSRERSVCQTTKAEVVGQGIVPLIDKRIILLRARRSQYELADETVFDTKHDI